MRMEGREEECKGGEDRRKAEAETEGKRQKGKGLGTAIQDDKRGKSTRNVKCK